MDYLIMLKNNIYLGLISHKRVKKFCCKKLNRFLNNESS